MEVANEQPQDVRAGMRHAQSRGGDDTARGTEPQGPPTRGAAIDVESAARPHIIDTLSGDAAGSLRMIDDDGHRLVDVDAVRAPAGCHRIIDTVSGNADEGRPHDRCGRAPVDRPRRRAQHRHGVRICGTGASE